MIANICTDVSCGSSELMPEYSLIDHGQNSPHRASINAVISASLPNATVRATVRGRRGTRGEIDTRAYGNFTAINLLRPNRTPSRMRRRDRAKYQQGRSATWTTASTAEANYCEAGKNKARRSGSFHIGSAAG